MKWNISSLIGYLTLGTASMLLMFCTNLTLNAYSSHDRIYIMHIHELAAQHLNTSIVTVLCYETYFRLPTVCWSICNSSAVYFFLIFIFFLICKHATLLIQLQDSSSLDSLMPLLHNCFSLLYCNCTFMKCFSKSEYKCTNEVNLLIYEWV